MPDKQFQENDRMNQKIAYYPGCTLKTQAKVFEDTAIAAARHLGMEFVEMRNWNCCGTVSSLANDNLMHHIAPLRVLTRALKDGDKKIATLCAVCWNTLKQSNLMVKNDPEKLKKINTFLTDEKDEQIEYSGEVEVFHMLEILRDKVGFENISKSVKNNLQKKVAPYYGCLFTRPGEISLDEKTEQPRIMSDLIKCLGGEPVDFPFAVECCGSYQVVNQKEIVKEKVRRILESARKGGAEVIACACPMCRYNLETFQDGNNPKMSVVYFTELMCNAFGLK